MSRTPPPKIAAVLYDRGADGDLLLASLAQRWQAEGARLAGCVQVNETYDPSCACDMTLRDLASGTDIRISQRLGQHSRGCRLDPAMLTQAVGMAEHSLMQGVDLLILNKFGKMEASGRGFRAIIAQAMEMDVPVLAGLNQANVEAWRAFAGEDAAYLPPEENAVSAWWHAVRSLAGVTA